MELPKAIRRTIRAAIKKHKDVSAQRELARKLVFRLLKAHPEFQQPLIEYAVDSLVYSGRHEETISTKREFFRPSSRLEPVNAIKNKAVRECFDDVYNRYNIGGTVLGDIYGEEIDGLISKEIGVRSGAQLNIDVLKWVKKIGVPDGKRIRDVIPAEKLVKTFPAVRTAAKAA